MKKIAMTVFGLGALIVAGCSRTNDTRPEANANLQQQAASQTQAISNAAAQREKENAAAHSSASPSADEERRRHGMGTLSPAPVDR